MRHLRGRAGEAGVTLIELLISIAILGLIMAPLTAAFIVYLKTNDKASAQLTESNGASLSSVYFAPDAAPSGGPHRGKQRLFWAGWRDRQDRSGGWYHHLVREPRERPLSGSVYRFDLRSRSLACARFGTRSRPSALLQRHVRQSLDVRRDQFELDHDHAHLSSAERLRRPASSNEENVMTRRIRAVREAHGEQGSALVIALVFVAVVGLVVAALGTFGGVSAKVDTAARGVRDAQYGADGALQGAVNWYQKDPNLATDCPGDGNDHAFFTYRADVASTGGPTQQVDYTVNCNWVAPQGDMQQNPTGLLPPSDVVSAGTAADPDWWPYGSVAAATAPPLCGTALDTRSVTDAVTNSTSSTVTSATANFTQRDVGAAITTNSAFKINTFIVSVNSATQATMSKRAASTTTGATMTMRPQSLCYLEPGFIEGGDPPPGGDTGAGYSGRVAVARHATSSVKFTFGNTSPPAPDPSPYGQVQAWVSHRECTTSCPSAVQSITVTTKDATGPTISCGTYSLPPAANSGGANFWPGAPPYATVDVTYQSVTGGNHTLFCLHNKATVQNAEITYTAQAGGQLDGVSLCVCAWARPQTADSETPPCTTGGGTDEFFTKVSGVKMCDSRGVLEAGEPTAVTASISSCGDLCSLNSHTRFAGTAVGAKHTLALTNWTWPAVGTVNYVVARISHVEDALSLVPSLTILFPGSGSDCVDMAIPPNSTNNGNTSKYAEYLIVLPADCIPTGPNNLTVKYSVTCTQTSPGRCDIGGTNSPRGYLDAVILDLKYVIGPGPGGGGGGGGSAGTETVALTTTNPATGAPAGQVCYDPDSGVESWVSGSAGTPCP